MSPEERRTLADARRLNRRAEQLRRLIAAELQQQRRTWWGRFLSRISL